MEEIWKPIKNFEELYEVSNLGRVKSLAKRGKPERIMKQAISHKGYPTLSLCKNAKSTRRAVHRLVAQAFIDNPDNLPQVNHIDGNKQNNNVENLEWCDNSYNQIHANKMGLNEHRIQRVKESCSRPIAMYDYKGNFIRAFSSLNKASRETNISNKAISYCALRKNKMSGGYKWQYIDYQK